MYANYQAFRIVGIGQVFTNVSSFQMTLRVFFLFQPLMASHNYEQFVFTVLFHAND